MQENARPAQSVSVIRSVGVARFGLLAAFTLALAMVTSWMFRLPYKTWDAWLARYPAHALYVIGVTVVGALWLRLQEQSESPELSPVRMSRRIVLIAVIAVSALPPDSIVTAVTMHPLLMAKALGGALVGLVLWQHLEPPRRVHRLSDGLESLVILIAGQLIGVLISIHYASTSGYTGELDPLSEILGITSLLGGLCLAVRARQIESGAGHATTAISLVVLELVLLVTVMPVASGR